MSENQRPSHAMKREVSADGGALFTTLVALWPYIWPSDRRDLKNRVLLATGLLFLAKLATLAVPFTFKWATDALSGHGSAPVAPSNWIAWAVATPIMMTIAYGGMRILMACITQLRDGIFAKVAMNAVRRLAFSTFAHVHKLSLRFHLERKTGGLTRVLERGRNGIETIVRMVLLQLVPTIVELVIDRLRAALSIRLAIRCRDRRSWSRSMSGSPSSRPSGASAFRRDMNESDSDANTKAVDSLLNYETVKYFNNEEHEARRFDRSMARYEDASVQAQTSLAVLNTGQAVIFTARARGIVMADVRLRHRRRAPSPSATS